MGLLLFNLTAYLYTRGLTGADLPGCRIVYMGPSYARITAFDEGHTKFASKYSLYLYREQGKDPFPDEKEGFSQLGGIPILFIPGNAGSYRQVRSIASETSNLYFDEYLHGEEGRFNPNAKNYDFFTADFNEDFTAFHGRTMLDQAEYLNEAIKFILSLYQNSETPPESVVILGHSMGGVVSRVMVSLPNYIPGSINTMLTLASPHAAAPLTFDGDILKIYSAVDRFWFDGYHESSETSSIAKIAEERLTNISLVSITGGLLDSILPADYTTLGYLVPPSNGFTVYTTGIPGVWTPIDHLAIVWCGQLRRQILRTLLDIANYNSPEKTYPLDVRMKVMRRNLLSGFEDYAVKDKIANDPYDREIKLKLDSEQINYVKTGNKLRIKPGSSPIEKMKPVMNIFDIPTDKGVQFSMLTSINIGAWEDPNTEEFSVRPTVLLCNKLNGDEQHDDIIDYTNDESREREVLKCIDASKDCNMVPRSTSGTRSLSESSIGGEEDPFYAVKFDSSVLRQYDSVLLTEASDVKTDDNNEFIIAELSDDNSTHFALEGELFSLITAGASISIPSGESISMNVKIPGAWSSILAYKLTLSNPNNEDEYTPMFQTFLRQWSNEPYEVKWHVDTDNQKEILLSMHGIAPYTPFKVKPLSEYGLNIEIWIDSSAKEPIDFHLRIDLLNSLRLLVLRYRLAIISYCVSIILLALIFQVRFYTQTNKFPTFLYGLSCMCAPKVLGAILFVLSALTPIMTNQPLQKLLNMIDPVVLQDPNEINLSLTEDFKLNSFFLGLEEKSLWFIGPVFFIMTLGIVLLSYYGLLALGIAITSLIRTVPSRFRPLSESRAASSSTSQWWRYRRYIGVAVVLLVIPIYMPYQFAYVISCIIQALQVIKILANDKSNKNVLNYHLSLLLLMLWILPINVPILIVFVHNMTINWTTPFSSHHNLLAILPVLMLMQRYSHKHTLPRIAGSHYRLTVALLAYYIFYCLVYGIRHTYWIHHLFNFVCCWLLVLHYDAPNHPART